MNKTEIIKTIAKDTGIPQTAVGDVLRSLEFHTEQALHRGEEVNLGFIKLKTVLRAARIGRNPKTGEQKEIPAKTAVKVVVGKSLKDAANGVAK